MKNSNFQLMFCRKALFRSNSLIKIFCSLIIISTLFSCHKEIDLIDKTPIPGEEPEVFILTDIEGKVVTENGYELFDYTVTVGNRQATIDGFGKFVIKDAKVSELGSVIKVEAPNFVTNYGIIFPDKEDVQYMEAVMVHESPLQIFDASQGALIEAFEGYTINIPPNAFTKASGTPYIGKVYLNSNFIDPSDDLEAQSIPGDGRVEISDNEIQSGLLSYGSLIVKVKDSAGNDLYVKDGIEFDISMPIPGALRNKAPQEIDIWSFDIDSFKWTKVGTATRDGNNYVSKSPKLYIISYAFRSDYVRLEFRLVDDQGLPMKFTYFNLRVDNAYPTVFSEHSNSRGLVKTYVPLGYQVDIQDVCTENSFIPLGNFTEDTDLGDINIFSTFNHQTLTGQIIDCDGNGIPNAEILLRNYVTDDVIYADANGFFEYNKSVCILNQVMYFLAKDPVTGNYSLPTYNVIGFNQPLADVGVIEICNNRFNSFSLDYKCDPDEPWIGMSTNNANVTYSVQRFETDIKNGTIIFESTDNVRGDKFELEIEYQGLYNQYLLANRYEVKSLKYNDDELHICHTQNFIGSGFAGWGDIQYVDIYLSASDDDTYSTSYFSFGAKLLLD